MATDYPNGVDNFTNPTATDNLDSVTVPHATQHANANDAIEAIETELGTNPKGTYASVKARLDAATASDTANEVVKRDANQSFSIGAINFDKTSTQTPAEAKLYWDGNGTLALGLLGGNVTVGVNQDIVCYVTNAEATTLNIGEVVYLFGAQGDRPTVKRASNTSDATSAKTFGFVAESIAAGQAGFVTIRGTARKINTSAFNPGDPLYLGSTPGTFTTTKPVAPNHLVYLGVVERANAGNGQIQVVVQNGYELDEIHDVLITSKTNGDYLVYESATNLWKNKQISATAPVTYDAATRTIAANSASTSASGVVQLTDSTSSTSTTTAATPNAVKSAYDLANAAIPATQKGAANGVATLDANSKVPQAQLPAVAITNTYVVASQAAMLALTAEEGDVAIRTDVSKSFILTAVPASTLGNWQELLSPPDAVTSVDGRTGVVTLTDLYTPLTRTISTTAPLAGGGNLSANRTLSLNIGSSLTTSASNLIVDSTIVPYLANANTFTAAQTATSFIVTGSTVPANGIYLPSANTLGFATNSAVRLQIDSTGSIGFPSIIGGATVSINRAATGNAIGWGIYNSSTIQSDVTNTYRTFASIPSTQATTFTLGSISHFYAGGTTVGSGSTITNIYGFATAANLAQATNNYGFFANSAAAGSVWNFYASGTAANYFAGQTTVGSTSLTLGSGSVAQQFGIVSAAASNVVAVIRGAASQTGNLTEWQNSAGTILSYVRNDGVIFATQGLQGTAWLSAGNYIAGATLISNTGTATNVGILARAAASQSADLVQLQNSSGTVLDAFDANGNQRSQAQLIQYGAEGSILQNIPTRVHPAETLLKQAVWWIDAAHPTASSQTISNLGWGGSALNVTNGSSTSADSNDAQYLAWDGVNYVYLPGTLNNWLSVPNQTSFNIAGDLDLRVQIAMDDWTPSTITSLLSKWSGSQTSYLFYLGQNGALALYWNNGTTAIVKASTVNNTITDGSVKWVRVTLDVDNGAGGNDVRFFTSDDGINWTQLGTTVTTSGVTSIASSTTNIGIGIRENGGTEPMAGKVFRAQILNGIDGVAVLDVDCSQITSGSTTSFTALTGQTVTVNRSTSGRKTVCVTNPLWLFGTDDYMEVNNRWLEHTGTNYLYLPGVASNDASAPDSAALDITGDIDLRCKVALDDWTPATEQGLVAKINSGNFSYGFTVLPTNGRLRLYWSADGTNLPFVDSTVAPTIADGATLWVRVTFDVDNGAGGNTATFFTSTDGTTWTQLGSSVTNTGVTSIFNSTTSLRVGSAFAGTQYPARGKFFRAQVLNGIGGTVAFDANFETGITTNLPTTFTESSANAATVTVNYSGTGYRSAGVIASTYVYPGNPNTFKLSTTSLLDFGATDSFTVIGAFRLFATPTSFGRLLSKKNAAANDIGYDIETNGTTRAPAFTVANGTANVFAASSTADATTALSVWGGVRDISATKSYYIQNGILSAGTTDTLSGSLANFYTLRVGNAGNGLGGSAAYQDMEMVAAAIFRRALTASEIAILNNYFQGRVA